MSHPDAEAEVNVRHAHGLHARPAVGVVRKAAQFSARVHIQNLSRNNATPHNAKSLTDLLLAAVDCGHRVRISACGPDAQEAVNALVAHIERL
jgi:phosphotransferase system HPr (HPr) family protein